MEWQGGGGSMLQLTEMHTNTLEGNNAICRRNASELSGLGSIPIRLVLRRTGVASMEYAVPRMEINLGVLSVGISWRTLRTPMVFDLEE